MRAVLRHAIRHVDRGASAVEYALLVGFFAVTLLGAIDALQGSAAERLEDQSEVAAQPVEMNGHFGPRDTIPPTPGGDTGDPEPPPTGFASVTLGGGSSVWNTGAHWDGSVTVTVKDADGNPIPHAQVVLSISAHDNQPLVTSEAGTAVASVTKVHKNTTVTFAVIEVVAEGHTFAEPFPSLTLSAPN